MAEDREDKPTLEIEKFLAMVNRLNDPEVKLRAGEESVDELLMVNFDKLSSYDKVTILKMAGLYIGPFKPVYSTEVRAENTEIEESKQEIVAQIKDSSSDDKLAVSKSTKSFVVKLAFSLLIIVFVLAGGFILSEVKYSEYLGMIKFPWSKS